MKRAWLTVPLILLSAAPATAQSASTSFLIDARLERRGADSDVGFGACVAWAGSLALVGDPLAGAAGNVAVRRYGSSTWVEEAVLAPAQLIPGAAFGASLDVDWDSASSAGSLIVGAPFDDDAIVDQGTAWIFECTNSVWVERARFTSPNATPSQRFAHAVTISGDTACVGEPFAMIGGSRSGAVHVYRRNGNDWVFEQTVSVSQSLLYEPHFGWSLDLRGDTLVVGAPATFHGPNSWGSVFVFRRSGQAWLEVARLCPTMGSGFSGFGELVDYEWPFLAASENAALGAPSGAVNVWYETGTEWHQEARFTSPNPGDPLEAFGSSIELVSGTLFVGASGDAEQGVLSGAVYAFHMEPRDWHLAAKLAAFDPAVGARFGSALSFDGARLLVGAPHAQQLSGQRTGTVYCFNYFQPELVGEGFCFGDGSQGSCPCTNASPLGWNSGCVNSTGRGARLYGRGSTSVAASDLAIECDGLPSARATFLIAALGATTTGPGAPIGDSLACVTSPRARGSPVWSDALGRAAWPAPSDLMPASWVAGTTVHLQAWFRDAVSACGHGTNLSSGLSVTLTD